eukprot:Gregarina_sp_Poly_1__7375@NODE_407_length_8828_cov_117_859034_g331_i0_p7_GENE_NODE_407_length_8828_cov_117_859034_g331_i0NODE_407_length_8828_cov_117_859034_g331_i0_p7_ORF_typecomplete_len116_score4_78_NODE_407_length_8828_cov_117_859034_g331_i07841131
MPVGVSSPSCPPLESKGSEDHAKNTCQEQKISCGREESESCCKEQSLAVLKLPDGREFTLAVLKPSYGNETILDIQSMFKDGKVLFYDPGFNSVASCTSAVTVTDGDKGECRYRG